MVRSLSKLIRLSSALLLVLALAGPIMAQDKKAKEDRLSGRIHMIDKNTSTITIRAGNVQRMVVYNADTKVTRRNGPGKMEDLKDGERVICLGKFDDKAKLVASRIDVR